MLRQSRPAVGRNFRLLKGNFLFGFPVNQNKQISASNFSRAVDETTFQRVEIETRLSYVNPNIQNSFAVGYCDSPLVSKAATSSDPQIFLKASQALAVEGTMGKIVFEQESKFAGCPVREFEYAAGGKANYSVRIKYILVGERIYLIYVVFLTANPYPEDRTFFFNSFKILANL